MDSFESNRLSVPARLPASRPPMPSVRVPGRPAEGHAITPLSVPMMLRATRRHWLLILFGSVVGSSLLGAVIYLKVKPSYTAVSLIEVEPASTDLFLMGRSGESADTYLLTNVNLITSTSVLTAASRDRGVLELPRIQRSTDVVQELRNLVRVQVRPGTKLIEVSMSSPSPHEAAIIVNAVVKEFIAANTVWSSDMNKTLTDKLRKQEQDLKFRSTDVKQKMIDLSKQADINLAPSLSNVAREGQSADARPGTPTSVNFEEYKTYSDAKLKVQMDLTVAESSLDSIRRAVEREAKNNQPLDPAEVEERVQYYLSMDSSLAELGEKVRAAKGQYDRIATMAKRSGPYDPAALQLKSAYDKLAGRYAQNRDARKAEIRERLNRSNPTTVANDQLEEATKHVETLRSQKETLEKQLKGFTLRARRENSDRTEMRFLEHEYEAYQSMHDTVDRRVAQLEFESKGETRISPRDPAVAPVLPTSDNRYKLLAVTPFGVLGTILALVVLLELRSGRVADPDFLSLKVRHEVFSIAPLPAMRPGDDATDEKAEQRLAQFVQSLDHLRVALCEGGRDGFGRCVMITSATGGEGKTTLSAHLAARCANAGTSTLLLDADLRRPALGRLLDRPLGLGLGDVLGGEVDVADAIDTVQAGGFHFLSAGSAGHDPSRVLTSHRLGDLIAQLRRKYDLIIIDTPPVLPVPDALILGRLVDGAVMASRFDASRLPLVERATRQLAVAGVPILGVVVNGVKGQSAYGHYTYNYNQPGRSDRAIEAPSVADVS